MAEVTKIEVEFIKESRILIRDILSTLSTPAYSSYKNYEIKIGFDEKNALPIISVKINKT